MLLDKPFTFESRRYDKKLPVIAASGKILHFDSRSRQRLFQCRPDLFRCNHNRDGTDLLLSLQVSSTRAPAHLNNRPFLTATLADQSPPGLFSSSPANLCPARPGLACRPSSNRNTSYAPSNPAADKMYRESRLSPVILKSRSCQAFGRFCDHDRKIV